MATILYTSDNDSAGNPVPNWDGFTGVLFIGILIAFITIGISKIPYKKIVPKKDNLISNNCVKNYTRSCQRIQFGDKKGQWKQVGRFLIKN